MDKTINKKSFSEVAENLELISWKLMLREAFYGHIIMGMNRKLVDNPKQVEVSEIRTLGISTVSVDFSYQLWSELDSDTKLSRFKHEVLHYVFMHPWQDNEKLNKGLFYIACDISANMYCNDKLSFNLASYSGLNNRFNIPMDTEEGWLSIYHSLVKMYKDIPPMIPIDKVPELVAQAMVGDFFERDGVTLKESIFFLPKGPSGDMNSSGMSGAIQSMLGSGATEDEITEFILDQLANPSDPWKGVKEGTSDLAAENLIKAAFKNAKERGDVPSNLEKYVDLFLAPPRIDWKQELRRFTSLMGNVEVRTSMTRRSKRWRDSRGRKIHPGTKIIRTQRIAIIVDTSGSVSEEEFQAFISELRGTLQTKCEVIFIQADAVVDQVDIYDKTLPEIVRISRWGNGGTSFDDALLYVKTRGKSDIHSHLPNIEDVDGVIYMTDGYAPAPELKNIPNKKLLWLTTQKSVEDMDSEGFTGKKVFLDLEEL